MGYREYRAEKKAEKLSSAVKAELENFKRFIEERGVADGAWRGTVENG